MKEERPSHGLHSTLPPDAGVIERELVRLWREASQDTEVAHRSHKIALSNIVVIAAAPDRREADAIINQYATRKPSRAILLVIDESLEEKTHAHISASCNLTDGMQEKLCWEKIIVEARPGDLGDLVGLVRSLAAGGEIPVILVDLYGVKRGIDLRRKIYGLAELVFVDGREQFQQMLPPPGVFGEMPIFGFEWVRIDSIREAVRGFFDTPHNLQLLDHLKRIVISFRPVGDTPTSSAYFLAGWMLSSLDLDIDAAAGNRVRLIAAGGGTVELEFKPVETEDGADIGLELYLDDRKETIYFSSSGSTACMQFGSERGDWRPARPFDRGAFVTEQSGKDRRRSSYGQSYRAAVTLFNLRQGMTGGRGMIVIDDSERLARVGSRLFFSLAIRTLAYREKFYVALAGGSTPKAVYREMVASPYAGAVDWDNVYFFFGDERPVGPEHPDSNFKLANDYFFKPLGIKESHVFRMEGENPVRRDACRDYARTMLSRLPLDGRGIPRFDLIFLGVGEDGHTASLFPDIDYDKLDPDLLVVHHYIPKLEQHRLSFTFRLINSARHVFFVATGKNKAEALQAVFFPHGGEPVPAARIRPENGHLLWLVDAPAVSRLAGMKLPLEVSRW